MRVDGQFIPPRLTEAERDAISTPVDGEVIYNTTIGSLQQYVVDKWDSVGSVITGPTIIDDGSVIMDTQSTKQNNYAPTGWDDCAALELNPTSNFQISGMAAPNPKRYVIKRVINSGTTGKQFTFTVQDTDSLADNRMDIKTNLVVDESESATFIYSVSKSMWIHDNSAQ